ncbi:tRNA (adenosine(37)-N6)-threonylcarbamoyltransferase complex dimerization subunit type 1 TsaB [Dechloromonas denitrificans]|uniref:tRNA (adenosine(37)-N6)-threonylcarbamoyltransferase complex dimerization subunit type 1 TsaB n=1 Tax=Dechloromonas denitrificans TaxID=281362 RepID=UPI001CF88AC8|nr:tRNA (adenosine(37)-N6)-threonylcarbamoyltransferase complex dimerization subunit type 1 TsaB [Dechloromonas denitrificans]UCV01810.1 tRNA (adenosine(37)-N6)-threonylcarbamoyltransferase complex dimerization subunit type 1 TsaB [Dechloromonas denitrificans]UCV06160.1 tRNA (adenosine(37)-N6)-threonylcarbamoyltransferase complex dimerization subunit type 1 TsaB [Dechloromonas denitrificans]
MLILALETSTELGSCALWRDGEVVERLCPSGRSHSETLLPLVRELLAEAGCQIGQLDAIAFGVGPGAFTGLRIACGAAQGLAVAGSIPLLPVTSLEAMAALSGGERVVAVLDARMGEVYSGHYLRSADGYQLQGEIRVSAPADVLLPSGAGWLACGNAIAAYPVLQQRLALAGVAQLPGILPTAAALARLAAPRAARGAGIDAALAAPLYIRDKVAKTVAERLSEGGRA